MSKYPYLTIEYLAVQSFVSNKQRGIDCTEEESAQIISWIKEFKFPEEHRLLANVQSLFPIEYGKALDEMDEINY